MLCQELSRGAELTVDVEFGSDRDKDRARERERERERERAELRAVVELVPSLPSMILYTRIEPRVIYVTILRAWRKTR